MLISEARLKKKQHNTKGFFHRIKVQLWFFKTQQKWKHFTTCLDLYEYLAHTFRIRVEIALVFILRLFIDYNYACFSYCTVLYDFNRFVSQWENEKGILCGY